MSSIYKLWFMRYKDPWYALSEPEQTALGAKVQQVIGQVGGKSLLMCTSLWANEKWISWGVEEFPNLEAVQLHSLNLYNLQWFRYINSWSILGEKSTPEGEVVIEKAPLYKAAIFRMKDAWSALPETEMNNWSDKMTKSYEQTGSKPLLFASSSWCDEQWQGWCVESYPSLEALQKRANWMEESGWYKYARAISMPGIRWPIE
jgi:hypothetical protein